MNRLPLTLVLAVLASPARPADTLAVLAVAEPPGPGTDLAELTHQLRAACRDRTGGVLDVPEMRSRLLGQVSGATLPELERAYAAAHATFQSEDFDGAARALRVILDDLDKLPDGPEVHALWERSMIRLAFAERLAGRAPAAAAVLDRLAALEPGFGVDEMQYPPSFRKEADQARRRAASQPKARLTVRSGERRATAFVDGKPLGPTPAVVALPPGRYRLGGRAGDVRVPSLFVQLEGGDRTIELDFAMAEAFRVDAGPGLALPIAQRAATLVGAGGWLGATRLVAVTELAEGDARFLDGALYEVQRGALVREGRVRMSAGAVPPAQLGALAAFLLTGQPGRGVAPVDPLAAAAAAAERSAVAKAQREPMGDTAPRRGGRPSAARVDAPGALGAGALALGLAGVATWQGLTARSRYRDADAMLRSDGVLQPGISQPSARRRARLGRLGQAERLPRRRRHAGLRRHRRRARLPLLGRARRAGRAVLSGGRGRRRGRGGRGLHLQGRLFPHRARSELHGHREPAGQLRAVVGADRLARRLGHPLARLDVAEVVTCQRQHLGARAGRGAPAPAHLGHRFPGYGEERERPEPDAR